MKENVGVLLPVSSLPSRHGIGDFGDSCYTFVKWLKKHHYKYWQILPLNPLGPGHSPYMSTCSEAIDPRYINLDYLVKLGYLDKVPDYKTKADKVDFEGVLEFKEKYLKQAYKNFMAGPHEALSKFKKANHWVAKFATYTIFSKKFKGTSWVNWDKEYKLYFDRHNTAPRKYMDKINYEIFKQMVAYKQWRKVWAYARKCGITLIADCPFYVGIDSVDCWLHKDQFMMDENYHPTLVSGCPPDAFSEDGQLWGTPIYNFAKMKEDNYSFLVERIAHLSKICDLLRLDHFRAWDTYCVIPAEDTNARRGQWWVGPRNDFFDTLYKKYPNIQLIAEDLGDLFPSVHELRDHYNLPGMFIMEFCIFDYEQISRTNQIVYPGTHDNQTLWGWYKSLNEEQIAFINQRLNYPNNLYRAIFDYIWEAPSLMTIFQLQDLLKLDDRARINSPGTTNDDNWAWKLKDFSWMKKVQYGQ